MILELVAVLVIPAWYVWELRIVPKWVAKQAARSECRVKGHAWGPPFEYGGSAYQGHKTPPGTARECRRCGYQEHMRDGKWPSA